MGMGPAARVLSADLLPSAESEGVLMYGVNMGINVGRRHARRDPAQSRLPVLNPLISL